MVKYPKGTPVKEVIGTDMDGDMNNPVDVNI
jgi:hypothetical protein